MTTVERSPGRGSRLGGIAVPLITVVVVLIIWEAVVRIFELPRWLLPAPSAIWAGFLETISTIPGHLWATTLETVSGFLLAVVSGIALAMLIAYTPWLERALYPLLVAVQSVPKIAIAPVVIIWFGFGFTKSIVIVYLVCFFPIVISTVTGLKSTPSEYIEMARTYEASKLEIFRRVRFPSALPHIFVGLKVGISLAVIGAVIAEFVGAREGLGYLIVISGGNVRTDIAFAAIILLGLISVLMFYGIVALERWLVPWSEEQTQPL